GVAAAQLGIAGKATSVDVGGAAQQRLTGSNNYTVKIAADDTLEDLIAKINALDAGVTAAGFTDGAGVTPHRFSLTSSVAGKAGELLIDTSGVSFSMNELARAQD